MKEQKADTMQGNTSTLPGGCWPLPTQELLLKAALLQGQPALDAWEQWVQTVDIDQLDGGSYRLLPLLYRSMQKHHVEHPHMKRLKGVYRQVWYKNQMLFHGMTKLLRALHERGIRTMVLKGTAMTALYYGEYGLRGMDDFDILVPVTQARTAINNLHALRWYEHFRFPEPLRDDYFSVLHSHTYADTSKRQFDLHWHVFPECCEPTDDDDLWEAAIPVVIDGVETLALCPADQVLHICTHGVRWNGVPPLRWIADLAVLLNNTPVDWERVLRQARNRQMMVLMREALTYVHELLGVPVPPEVLHELRTAAVSPLEHKEYELRMVPSGDRWNALKYTWYNFSRSTTKLSLAERVLRFPRVVQLVCRLDRLWHLPVYGMQLLLGRATGPRESFVGREYLSEK